MAPTRPAGPRRLAGRTCSPRFPGDCHGNEFELWELLQHMFDNIGVRCSASQHCVPSAVDWDEDGDVDLVLAMATELLYYERVGHDEFLLHDGVDNPFDGLDVGRDPIPVFADFFGNGRGADLITGTATGRVRIFERGADGQLVEHDTRVDIGGDAAAAAADWDGDGDVDLAVAGDDGYLRYFERTGPEELTQQIGAFRNPFDGISMAGRSTPSLVDWDSDGDVDLIVASPSGTLRYFERLGSGHLLEREGASNPLENIWPSSPGELNAFRMASAVADWNGDGLLEILLGISGPREGVVRYFEQRQVRQAVERTGNSNPFKGVSMRNMLSIGLADLSGSGGLHLMVSDGQLLRGYGRLPSGAVMPAAAPALDLLAAEASGQGRLNDASVPVLADWDGDGDKDIIVGHLDGTLSYFEMVANSSLVLRKADASNPFEGISLGPVRAVPVVLDWDGDGDLDLILADSNGTLRLFIRQEGVLKERPLTAGNHPFRDISLEGEVFPAAADLDGDGDLDLIVAGNAAGGLRFFERLARDAVVERQGASENPLHYIDAEPAATLAMTDWDGDGDEDLLLTTSKGTIRYFARAHCPSSDTCNFQGACDPLLSICSCLSSRSNGPATDCSACAAQHYASQRTTSDLGDCMACPGLGSGAGLCAGKGRCRDDRGAVRAAGADEDAFSNTTASLQVGDGHCECDEFFSGRDAWGRSTCAEGVCPGGMELLYQEAEQTKVCSACQSGYYKASAGNDACSRCPAGRFSAANLSTCDPCPAGRYSATADSGSVGDCQECPQGRYNPGGDYDDPRSACIACRARGGTLSVGATSSADCIEPVSKQHFVCIVGQRCVLEDFQGHGLLDMHQLNAFQAAGPSEASVCGFTGVASGFEGSAAVVVVAESSTTMAWAGEVVASGGLYELCWCSGLDALDPDCRQPTSFDFSAGSLEVLGPYHMTYSCTRGLPCTDVKVQHHGLTYDSGLFQVQMLSCASSSQALLHGRTAESLSFDDNTTKSPSEGSLLIDFVDYAAEPSTDGVGVLTVPPGVYKLCFCMFTPGASTCSSDNSQNVLVGDLVIDGAETGHEFACVVGRPCRLPALRGVGLLPAADRLLVMTDCAAGGAAIRELPGAGLLVQDVATGQFVFEGEADGILLAAAGDYRLCFCRGAPPFTGEMQDARSDVSLAGVGVLSIRGPSGGGRFRCKAGAECSVELAGSNLVDGDAVLLLPTCGGQGWPSTPGIPAMATVATNSTGVPHSRQTFSFGLLDLAELRLGEHALRLCWCPGGSGVGAEEQAGGCSRAEKFRVDVGSLEIVCPEGYFLVGAVGHQRCALCTRGYYCDGVSGRKMRCPAPETTPDLGARSMSDCLCDSGAYYDHGQRSCQLCPAGRYQPDVNRLSSCPFQCADSLLHTTPPGARNASQCYCKSAELCNDTRGASSTSGAAVPTLGGVVTLGLSPNVSAAEEEQINRDQKRALADAYGVLPASVDISITRRLRGRSADAHSERELQESDASIVELKYLVRFQTAEEATTAKQNLIVDEAAAVVKQLHPELVRAISLTDEPSVSSLELQCPVGMAFPYGIRPTSLDDCACALGHEPSSSGDLEPGACSMCGKGAYKSSIADTNCQACPESEGGETPLTTAEPGATSPAACICPLGWFAADSTKPHHCSSVDLCKEGTYYDDASERCEKCPAGLRCGGDEFQLGDVPPEASPGFDCPDCPSESKEVRISAKSLLTAPLGLTWQSQDKRRLLVDGVGLGALREWNEQQATSAQVRPGDQIVEVNGLRASPRALQDKIERIVSVRQGDEGADLRLRFLRPPARPSGRDAMSVFQCMPASRCLGANQCAAGRDHSTLACSHCLEFHRPGNDGECKECHPLDFLALFAVLAVLLPSFVLAILIVGTPGVRLRASMVAALSTVGLMITTAEYLMAISKINFQGSGGAKPARSLMDMLSVVALDTKIFQLSCFGATDAVTEYALGILCLPLAALAAVAVVALRLRLQESMDLVSHARVYLRLGDEGGAFLDESINAIGLVYFTFFVSVWISVLEPFHCYSHPSPPAGGEVWKSMTAYPEVLCWQGGDHTAMLLIGLLGTLGVAVPFVALCAWATWMYPKAAHSHREDILLRFRFLFRHLRPGRHFYAMFLLIRGIVIVAVPVMFSRDIVLQTILTCFILLASCVVVAALQPWRAPLVNVAEIAVLAVFQLLIACAALSSNPGDLALDTSSLGGSEVVLCTLLFLSLVAAFAHSAYKYYNPRLHRFGHYICHDKASCGAQARLLQQLLERTSGEPCFLDSDYDYAAHLDADNGFDIVRASLKTLVVLSNRDTMTSAWCIAEMATAIANGVQIVAVEDESAVLLSEREVDTVFDEQLLGSATSVLLPQQGVSVNVAKDALRRVQGLQPLRLKASPGREDFHELALDIVERSLGAGNDSYEALMELRSKAIAASEGSAAADLTDAIPPDLCLLTDPTDPEAAAGAFLLLDKLRALRGPEAPVWASVERQEASFSEVLESVRQSRHVAVMLSAWGWTPLTAKTLQYWSALTVALRSCPDLSVLTIAMPDFSEPNRGFFERVAEQLSGTELDSETRHALSEVGLKPADVTTCLKELFSCVSLPFNTHGSLALLEAQAIEIAEHLEARSAARHTSDDGDEMREPSEDGALLESPLREEAAAQEEVVAGDGSLPGADPDPGEQQQGSPEEPSGRPPMLNGTSGLSHHNGFNNGAPPDLSNGSARGHGHGFNGAPPDLSNGAANGHGHGFNNGAPPDLSNGAANGHGNATLHEKTAGIKGDALNGHGHGGPLHENEVSVKGDTLNGHGHDPPHEAHVSVKGDALQGSCNNELAALEAGQLRLETGAAMENESKSDCTATREEGHTQGGGAEEAAVAEKTVTKDHERRKEKKSRGAEGEESRDERRRRRREEKEERRRSGDSRQRSNTEQSQSSGNSEDRSMWLPQLPSSESLGNGPHRLVSAEALENAMAARLDDDEGGPDIVSVLQGEQRLVAEAAREFWLTVEDEAIQEEQPTRTALPQVPGEGPRQKARSETWMLPPVAAETRGLRHCLNEPVQPVSPRMVGPPEQDGVRGASASARSSLAPAATKKKKVSQPEQPRMPQSS
eukprot:TRINITY_DN2842_c0_g1_i1.p1 TRINITY_DN2842_c0_g1~~TRINITY_DN2842_c0_g1_i1.p1  ORF type:complete len:3578 (-),score=754.01 TRINITY_DN2842_c0_g1_i1:180-9467(-)